MRFATHPSVCAIVLLVSVVAWAGSPQSHPGPVGSKGGTLLKSVPATQPAAGAANPGLAAGPLQALLQGQATTIGGAGVGTSFPFAPLMPSLSTAVGPYWLKEGVRLTYYLAVAYVPLTDHYFYRDDEGGWVDGQGNRYKREANIGGGGDGISQVNITYVDAQKAVAHVRTYTYSNWPGPLVPLMTQGRIVSPAAADDWWVSPSSLREAATGTRGGVKVLRGPYTVKGKTYNAVRFEMQGQQSQAVYTFDEVTGLLLHMHQIVYGSDKQTLVSSTFVEWRKVKYPWAGMPPPAWLAGATQLQYAGTRVVSIPGVEPQAMPLTAVASITHKEPRWVSYTMQSMVQMPGGMPQTPSESQLVAGPCQFGGIWMSPQGLRALRAGQVLDQDRAANTTVSVSQAGAAAVQITETGAAHSLTFTYDTSSGMMLSSTLTDNLAHAETSLMLRQ